MTNKLRLSAPMVLCVNLAATAGCGGGTDGGETPPAAVTDAGPIGRQDAQLGGDTQAIPNGTSNPGDAGSVSVMNPQGSDAASVKSGDSGTVVTPPVPGGGGPATFDDLDVGDRAQDQFHEFPLVIGSASGTVRCWIPGGVKVVRGMGINASQGNHAKEFARLVNFGLISFDGEYNPWPERLDMALNMCGERSKHPELAHGVFISSGHSRSTTPGAHSVTRIPERMVASAPGGLPYVPPPGPSQKVPVMSWYGSRDTSQSKGSVENLEKVRPMGALFGIAPHWNGGHVYGYGNNLALVFFAQVIARRYPSTESPMGGQVKLKEMTESEGWLGDRNGWIPEANGSGNFKAIEPNTLPIIAKFADFKGDKGKAIWLPDSYTAHVWRAYATPNDTVRMVFPNPQQSEDKAPLTMIEPGGVFTAKVSVTGGPGAVKKVQLMDGDKLLGEATAAPYEFPGIKLHPGIHALIALATFEGGQVVSSRPATVYGMRISSCPEAVAGSFPITCVKKP